MAEMSRNPQLAPDTAQAPTPAVSPARVAASGSGSQTHDGIKPDGIRDTIDSIVVAFILAFVFRAFIVEAFVIPTGSMAPSLYGMHGQHRCAKCNYSFAYGIREPMVNPNPGSGIIPGTIFNDRGERSPFTVRCPNCTWSGKGNSHLNTPGNPAAPDSGDRILVLKWPYDFGTTFLGPKRWDVVVFKNPQDGEVNFIKRLLGLPGEVLQIINGDVYTAPAKSVPKDILESLRSEPPRDSMRTRLSEDQFKRLARLLKIQRKTAVAQESLWMLHYDHDFVPVGLPGVTDFGQFAPPGWTERDAGPTPCWSTSTPAVRFKPADTEQHWIDLTGHRIEDSYGYNNVLEGPSMEPRPVGDVLLKFVLVPESGDGELTLYLQKGMDRFQTHISSKGGVRLERFNDAIRGGYWEELRKGESAALVPGQPVEVEFENLDYRIALRINGEEIVATDDVQYAPKPERVLLPTYEDGAGQVASVAVGAKTMALELRHLQVLRDVFYRSDSITEPPLFNRAPGWGTAMNPIYLRESPQDFFCCGDNSPQSKDSRLWTDVCPMLRSRKPPNDYQYGTVPGDQLIGRAFFVYWPSGLRFSKGTMAVIPNVGRMRLIR